MEITKDKTVCLSSTEAEYTALTEMCKQQNFLVMLMKEVFEVENEATVYLHKNMHVSSRTKHIDIKYHYRRESK